MSTHNFEFLCSFFLGMDSLQKGQIVYFFLIFCDIPFRSLIHFSVLTGTQQVLNILRWFVHVWKVQMKAINIPRYEIPPLIKRG